MDRRKIRNGFAWVLSALLILAFLIASVPKLLGAHVWIAKFANWGYPEWFVFFIGALELLGAVLLLAPRVAIYGTGLLGIIMVGASYTHLANGEGLEVVRPLVYLVLLAMMVWLRRPAQG